ncbi:MAG: HEAT repeat domain-containing protein [Candidatus Hydrogenedentes bacterium]|nr:HEAT repeat domain-containing protein [Candidatus Hydrogenedentota bacterium]
MILKRKPHVHALILTLLLALPVFADAFHIRPHVQNITTDGATIIWETQELGIGTVEYGPKGTFDQQAKESAPATIHRVRIAGLAPESSYSFRVRVGQDAAESFFKTAPGSDRPITFVAVGDTRRWEKRWQETNMAEHTLQWNPEFYVINGDLVVSGHKKELWPEHFERFGPLADKYMFVTARGNHEGSFFNDNENDWFGKYHEMPAPGEPLFSFDWGNSHFAVISHEMMAGEERIKQTMAWLDEDLTRSKKKHEFVLHHYPIVCTGYYSPTESRKEDGTMFAELARVLDKHHVAVDMSGHTHIYERLYPLRAGKRDDRNGTTYVVQGGDINANFPDWWTAVGDDTTTQAKPTYTVFQCKDDRIEFRTFCWSPVENKTVQIDYNVIWQDESIPSKVLASLPSLKGEALVKAVEELGAMLYAPAGQKLLSYLAPDQPVEVRRAAASSLRALGSESLAPALLSYVKDVDAIVRQEAARALEIAMPSDLSNAVAKLAADEKLEDRVRKSLIGALQFHAPAKLTHKVTLAILNDAAAPVPVRQRAAYALGRVATKQDVRTLAKRIEQEPDNYVMMRYAWLLNRLTGVQVSLDGKAPLATSEPGKRREFVQQWLKG